MGNCFLLACLCLLVDAQVTTTQTLCVCVYVLFCSVLFCLCHFLNQHRNCSVCLCPRLSLCVAVCVFFDETIVNTRPFHFSATQDRTMPTSTSAGKPQKCAFFWGGGLQCKSKRTRWVEAGEGEATVTKHAVVVFQTPRPTVLARP